ncbi:helix-turn-helix domain-containing protein [Glutamicibacter sp.]|uniref:helix-turn-helix domain-containing protein n=1 Tax=Glutamicibacter sp. TaxID=1931995 RepID=UPI003D6AF461
MAETDVALDETRHALDRAEARTRSLRTLLLALSETSVAISTVRQGDNVLRQIVTRTRTIVGVDMAYISLNEEAQTRIIETDGVWTQAYREIRMPLGYGVLGSVAKADGPIQVMDYDSATSLNHIDEIDAVVRAEGVKAIMGAPLRVGEDIIGALMVADRVKHSFTHEQIFALEALANQVAVALENQRHVNALRATMLEMEQANSDYRSANEQLEHLARADVQLFKAIGEPQGLLRLGAVLGDLLGLPVHVLDLTIRQSAGHGNGEMLHPARTIIPLSRKKNEPVAGTLADGTTITVMAAVLDGQTLGALVVQGTLHGVQRAILLRGAMVLGSLIGHSGAGRHDQQKRRTELLATLLAPAEGGHRAHTLEQMAAYGLRRGEPYQVGIVQGTDSSLTGFEDALEALQGEHLLRARFNDQLYLVAPQESFSAVVDLLKKPGARRFGGIRMAHGPVELDLDQTGEGFSLVERMLLAAGSLEHVGNVISWESLGTIGIFLANADAQTIQQTLRLTLGPLLDYDQKSGSALADTALAFLDESRNVVRTAAVLGCHANTVRQRLDRINLMLGEGWSEGRLALDHHVLLIASRITRK